MPGLEREREREREGQTEEGKETERGREGETERRGSSVFLKEKEKQRETWIIVQIHSDLSLRENERAGGKGGEREGADLCVICVCACV